MQEGLVHVGSCALDGAGKGFGLEIKETLNHKESALVGELTVKEEFELCTELTGGHALYVFFFEVVFDSLGSELVVKSERFVERTAATDWELHPELLESFGIKLRNRAESDLRLVAVQ